MLILTRRIGEGVLIGCDASVPLLLTVAELFAAGPIVVTVENICKGQVRLGFKADPLFKILRDELAGKK